MNYQQYRAEDFMMEESFQAWFYRTNPRDVAFWESWIAANPEKGSEIEAATRLLRLLQKPQSQPDDAAQERAENRLLASIEKWENRRAVPVVPLRRVSLWQVGIAASLVLAITALLGIWWMNRPVTYATGYGENRTITLPDQSVVTLNSNSTLSYEKDWDEGNMRAVHLEGEAFFSVRHTASHAKFLVRTGQVQVEVLGTEFNVNNRRDRVQVVLNSGKVQLSVPESAEKILMQPNEKVEYVAGKTRKTPVNAQQVAAWRERKLIFDETPLPEVARMIEDNYGVSVTLADSRLASRKLSGTANLSSLDVLLTSISDLFDVRIDKQGDTIIIQPQ